MVAYSIDVTGLAALQAGLRAAPQLVIRELERATAEADSVILNEIDARVPKGATETLRKSLFQEEQATASGVIGLVATAQQHAIPVELGTRPHMPPVEPLIDWVKAKLGISSDKAARGVAFAIAKKISVRGTVGQFPFQLGALAAEAEVHRIYDQAVIRIAEGLGKAS